MGVLVSFLAKKAGVNTFINIKNGKPNENAIRLYDELITSGLGKLYPYGFPVARAANINADSSSQFYQVDALPISNIENNNQVVVLLSDNGQY